MTTIPLRYLIAITTVLASTSVHAISTVYTVTSTSTNSAGAECTGNSTTDLNCTLDAAINTAATSDHIQFAPSVQGQVIDAHSGLPNLTRDVTIDGSPDGVTIDAGGTARAFYVQGGNITLRRLTIQHASANSGAGMYNAGGNVTIDSCTFAGNTAANGGGAYQGGSTLTVLNSTFVGNQGGGGAGGAIYISPGGNAVIAYSTFTGNSGVSGGAIIVGGTLSILSSVVAGNTAAFAPDVINDSTLTSLGHNLVGNSSNSGWTALPTDLMDVDPLFDSSLLFDNGGPTKTVALQAGSPARSGGDCSGHASSPAILSVLDDQRGFLRSTPCTIGAFDMTSIFQGTFEAE